MHDPRGDGIRKAHTESPKLTQLRRGVMELYISDHPLYCVDVPCQWPLRASGHGRRPRHHRVLDACSGKNHQQLPADTSNPYFNFDPTMCIVCSRCVRACDEVQGTFALTIQGRGFNSKVSASQNESFLASECVSCGACVEACPTVALTEKSVVAMGRPERVATTTCAYCGVGCSFNAEVKDGQVVRMAPNRNGRANHGHACVKGRFALATRHTPTASPRPWSGVGSTNRGSRSAGTKRSATQPASSDASRPSTGETRSAASRLRDAQTKRRFWCRTWFVPRSATTTWTRAREYVTPPTGYGLKNTIGESAGTAGVRLRG